MRLKCPVKTGAFGPINNQADLQSLVRMRGQFFGQDLSGRACDFNKALPCDKTLYEAMGWGPHKGIDIPVETGTEVFASTDGKVSRVSDDVTQGIGVVIWDPIQSIETVYWHLKSHSVMPGDLVKVGQLIALSNNTGYSIGAHLHFQVNLTDAHGKSGQAIDPINLFVWDNDMLRMVKLNDDNDKNVWLVHNGERSLIQNSGAFQKIGGNIDLVEKLTQEQFNALPDSGRAIAEIVQE